MVDVAAGLEPCGMRGGLKPTAYVCVRQGTWEPGLIPDLTLVDVAAGLEPCGMRGGLKPTAYVCVRQGKWEQGLGAPRFSPIFKSPDELAAGSPLLFDMLDDAT